MDTVDGKPFPFEEHEMDTELPSPLPPLDVQRGGGELRKW